MTEATEYYERSINALRKARDKTDKDTTQKIVSTYATLLRAHKGAEKAEKLENEFFKTPNTLEK